MRKVGPLASLGARIKGSSHLIEKDTYILLAGL